MNVDQRNSLFASGKIDRDDLWPKVKDYEKRRFQFRWEFGLTDLPTEPGLITIRGPRQIGKSTWLELKLLSTLEEFGKGSAFFLNGDYIYSHDEFSEKLLDLEAAFNPRAKVKRIFIDEITQIKDWQRVLKRLIDAGHLKDVLIITTGSNAADLLRGAEKLPGRKGALKRTDFVFLPISFKEFYYQVRDEVGMFKDDAVWAYILSGGSPLAVDAIYRDEGVDDTFTTLISDWVLGDFAGSGRSRIFLTSIFRQLYKVAPNPISYTKLAQNSGLSNNTAALDYIERLSDLLCIHPMTQWDSDKEAPLVRKPSKLPFINLAVAWAFHPDAPRYLHELRNFKGQQKGAMFEWVVAQELWRRLQLEAQTAPSADSQIILKKQKSIGSHTHLMYWASKTNEIDFVLPCGEMIEVKSGASSALEFNWFRKTHPKKKLKVICENTFDSDFSVGMTLKDFLLEAPSDLYFDSDRAPWLFDSSELQTK